jgi:hypothetical protein
MPSIIKGIISIIIASRFACGKALIIVSIVLSMIDMSCSPI